MSYSPVDSASNSVLCRRTRCEEQAGGDILNGESLVYPFIGAPRRPVSHFLADLTSSLGEALLNNNQTWVVEKNYVDHSQR